MHRYLQLDVVSTRQGTCSWPLTPAVFSSQLAASQLPCSLPACMPLTDDPRVCIMPSRSDSAAPCFFWGGALCARSPVRFFTTLQAKLLSGTAKVRQVVVVDVDGNCRKAAFVDPIHAIRAAPSPRPVVRGVCSFSTTTARAPMGLEGAGLSCLFPCQRCDDCQASCAVPSPRRSCKPILQPRFFLHRGTAVRILNTTFRRPLFLPFFFGRSYTG